MILVLLIFLFLIVSYQYYAASHYLSNTKNKLHAIWVVYQPLILIGVIIAVTLIFGNLVFKPADLITPDKKVAFGEKYDRANIRYKGYKELTRTFPENPDYAFNLVNAARDFRNDYELDRSTLMNIKYEVHEYFEKQSEDKNERISDVGKIFMAYYKAVIDPDASIFDDLGSVSDTTIKYYHFVRGYAHMIYGETVRAERHYDAAISSGTVKPAVRWASQMHYQVNSDYEKIYEFLIDKNLRSHVPGGIAKRTYFAQWDIPGYLGSIAQRIIREFNWFGCVASLLVSLIWIGFLIRIDSFQSNSWFSLFLCFALGAIFSNGVYFLSDLLHMLTGMSMDGTFWGDFFYSVVGIGAVEELVKLLPWLLLLWFTKYIQEPFDFALYASASALGFAFAENLFYFNEAGLDNINIRAMMAVSSHIFDATVVVYMALYFKLKLKRSRGMLEGGLVGYILASFTHGFYDFWLLHNFDSNAWFITIIFFLVTIHFWLTMLNNLLNQSPLFDKEKASVQDHSVYLASSLAGVVMLEYVVLGFNYGLDFANQRFYGSMFSSGYLLFYLSSNLSRIEPIQGYWAPLNFSIAAFSGLKTRARDYIGLRLKILPITHRSTFDSKLPMQVEIIDRITLGDNPNWFVARPDEDLTFTKFFNDRMIMYFPKDTGYLNSGELELTNIYLISKDKDIERKSWKKSDIKKVCTARSIAVFPKS